MGKYSRIYINGQWAVEEAVGNLTEKLNQIFENNE